MDKKATRILELPSNGSQSNTPLEAEPKKVELKWSYWLPGFVPLFHKKENGGLVLKDLTGSS